MELAMADLTADTAAAMLVAVRSAQLSKQPLAVGLADALDELVERLPEDHETGRLLSCDCVEAIIDHLRNNHV